MHGYKSYRQMLEMQPKVGQEPDEADEVRAWVWAARHRRQRRQNIHCNQPCRRRPSEPSAGNFAPRRHPARETMDYLRAQHGDPVERRAVGNQPQDHRRAGQAGPLGAGRGHNFAVRQKCDYTLFTHSRHQGQQWRHDQRLVEPFRAPDEKRGRWDFRIRIHKYLDRSHFHVQLRGWTDRCG